MKKKGKKKKKVYKKRKIDLSQQEDYEYHLPVLLKECVDYLVTDPDGRYIDGTLGGGGHTSEILSRLGEAGKLYSFDKDERSIAHNMEQFSDELARGETGRLTIIQDCFSNACSIKGIRGDFQGVLLDLGLSSRQLDDSRRGFSYRANSELDMRFGSQGRSAEELLNAANEDELEALFRNYGEEPFSKQIARRIVDIRRAAPLKTTFELKNIIEETVPFRFKMKSLSRVFQAVRIAVNDELSILEDALECFIDTLLASGGRIVVMSYHSLEDRIVKNAFRSRAQRTKYGVTNSMPKLKLITSKPIIPDEEEILKNPRARSAKLRVAEKL